MPLSKKWAKATDRKLRDIPNNVGVYEIGYNKRITYIGSGVVSDRINAHSFPMTHVRYVETNSRERATQLERKHLKKYESENGRLPKHNDRIPAPPR